MGPPFAPVHVNIRGQELLSIQRDFLLSGATDYRIVTTAVSWMRRWKLILFAPSPIDIIFFSAGSEDRATLGSNPSAAAGDEGMRAGALRLYLSLPHAFVFNAVNPGGIGGWPP